MMQKNYVVKSFGNLINHIPKLYFSNVENAFDCSNKIAKKYNMNIVSNTTTLFTEKNYSSVDTAILYIEGERNCVNIEVIDIRSQRNRNKRTEY